MPTLNFNTTVASVAEGTSTVRAQVNINLAPSVDLPVSYLITGSAVAPRDFTAPAGVTLAAGEDSVEIPIAIADNGLITDDLTVVVTLVSLGGTVVGDANQFTLTVQNTDIVPVANDGSLSAHVDADASGVLTSNVVPGSTVTAQYLVADPPTGGTVNITDPSTGAYVYTAGSSPGPDSFTFTVTTGPNTVSAIATVNIDVTYPVPAITPPASAAYLFNSPVFTGDTLALEASVDANAQSDIACEVSTALDSSDPAAVAGPVDCALLPSLILGNGTNGGAARGTASYVAANGNALLTWTPTRQQRGTYFFHLTAQGLGNPGSADFVVTVDSPRVQPTALFDAAFAKLAPVPGAGGASAAAPLSPLSPLLSTDAVARVPNLLDANSLAALDGYGGGSPWTGLWPYSLTTNASGAPAQSATFAGVGGNANSYKVSAWLAPLNASSPGAVVLSNLQGAKGFTLRQSAHTPGALELAVGVLPSVAYRQAVLADQPVAYWPFDEATGPFASLANPGAGLTIDPAGAAANTVTPGATGLLMGDPNTGLLLNNASALQASDPCQLLKPGVEVVPQGQVSVEAWVQFENLSSDQTLISTESLALNSGYALVVETMQGTTYFAFNTGTFFGQLGVVSATTPQVGAIYHVVGTYDGQTMRIYVNGQLDGQTQIGQLAPPAGFYVGAQPAGTGRLTGTLDEVAAYAYPLSAAQVLRHFRVGAEDPALSGPYANVIDADLPTAHWPLNELAGKVAHNNLPGPPAAYVGAVDLGHATHDGARAAGFTRADTGAVVVDPDPVLDLVNGSVELWVRPVWQNATQAQTLAVLGNASNNRLVLQLTPGNAASDGFTAVTLSSGGNSAAFSTSLQDQVWHHVVYTQIGGRAAVYADGKLAGAQALDIVAPTGLSLTLGATRDGDQRFVGDMHDVALYDRPLSGVDVQLHHAQHRALACQAVTRWEDGQWHQVGVSYAASASGPGTAALWVDGAAECAFAPMGDGTAAADLSVAAVQGLSPPWYGAVAQVAFSAGASAAGAEFADFAAQAEAFRRVAEGDVVEPYAQSAASAPVYTFDAANPMGAGRYTVGGQADCGVNATVWKNLASTAGSASLAGYAMSRCATGEVWSGDGSVSAPYALQFDGSSGYVELPADATDWSQGLTVEIWANPNALGGAVSLLELGGGDISNGNGNSNNIVLSAGGANAGRLQLAIAAPGSNNALFVDDVVEAQAWHQYVATVVVAGGSSGGQVSWHLYRDGAELTGGVAAGGSVVPQPTLRANSYLGRSNASGSALFQGQLGTARVYKRGLSAAEVRQNCQMQAPRYGIACL